jgi:hypothetical protein
MFVDSAETSLLLIATLGSLVCDYTLRQKLSGTHVDRTNMEQVPVPHPTTFQQLAAWQPSLTLHEWLRPRILELVYTSWSLQSWAADLEHHQPPYVWDSERRPVIQAEIDAAMFHTYGLDRDQTVHILSTFRVLGAAEIREYGEYRTERLVLERYDAMAHALSAGGSYQTSTDPAPGSGPRHAAESRQRPS